MPFPQENQSIIVSKKCLLKLRKILTLQRALSVLGEIHFHDTSSYQISLHAAFSFWFKWVHCDYDEPQAMDILKLFQVKCHFNSFSELTLATSFIVFYNIFHPPITYFITFRYLFLSITHDMFVFAFLPPMAPYLQINTSQCS